MGKFKLKMDNMRRNYEMQDREGDYFKIPGGDSIVYIHPPCRTEEAIKAEIDFYTNKKMNKEKRQKYIDVLNLFDGVNFLEVHVHFGVGKNNRMAVCLDEMNNPVINHPIFQKYLRKKGIKLTGECPTCSAIENGEFDDEQMDSSKLQKRFLFGVTPIKSREKPSKDWVKIPPSPTVLWAGKTIFDGIMDLFFDSEDITDPEEAIYAKINRKGKGKFDTKYKITADAQSLKKPKKLSKKFVELVEKAMQGGSSDLFKILADSTMSADEIAASMSGVKVEHSRDDDEDEDERDDVEVGEDEDEDEEEEKATDDDEDEDSDDEDDDEEDDSEDSEDDDEDDDSEDSEDDDEDDDEDDEPEPEPEPKKKPARKAKKPPKKEKKPAKKAVRDDDIDDEDEEDEDLDDLDAELERIKKKAKPKAKPKAKAKKK